MRIKLYDFDHDTIEMDNCVVTIELEAQKLFVAMVKYFWGGEEESRFGVLDQEKSIEPKDMLVLTNILDINLVQKSFLTKLYKKIEKDISDEYNEKLQLEQMYVTIKKNLDNLIKKYNIELEINQEIDIKKLLDFVELKPCTSDDYFENLLNLVAMSAELKLYKVLVLVNQKAFLDMEQLTELYKYALYKKQPIIMIENKHMQEIIPNEKKLFVDCEMFEFLI